jgi:uncharacterized Fe-S cluster-containing radical SAM superfamily protein
MQQEDAFVTNRRSFDICLADKAFGRSRTMEELHRLHKDVPFGWVALLQELFTERARRNAAKASGERAPVTRTA